MVHTLYQTSRYENKNFYGSKFQQRQILNGQSLHVKAVMKWWRSTGTSRPQRTPVCIP